MDTPQPEERRARPAWGCLDGEEVRAAARGVGDPGIREHLARCPGCRRLVQDLRRELGHPGRSSERRHRSSLLARPALWLLLLGGALVVVAAVVFTRRADEASPVTAAPAAVPATPAEAAEATPIRRARPRARRVGQQPLDAEIVATIRRNESGVRICYERALKRDAGLTPRLEVQVSVTPAGAVEHVSIDGPPRTRELTGCIRNVVMTWQFPRAPEAYRSTFPLRLQRRE
jgi:hypothetical protein